jgi:hypothetical protein
MSAFEFVFSLFGLLLGFSLVEVLGGLGKVLKSRRHVRAGGLTPLLALFVMIDITSFWMMAWLAREVIPANAVSLFTGLVICGLYYLAAILVFPDDPAERGELDSHFFEQKAKVLAGVLACNVLAYSARAWAQGGFGINYTPWDWSVFAAYFIVLTAAIFVRGQRWNAACLALLILLYAADAIISARAA